MKCPIYDKLDGSNLLKITDESTVGELTSTVEKFYNLPEGTIIIRHPENSRYKVTAKLSTVRKEWGYN